MKKLAIALLIMIFTISSIQAQKEEKKDGKEELIVKLREGAKPIIYVDGKIFDFPMELLDQSKIASVFVVKGEDAKTKYKAPDGVILITTKSFELIKISEESITKNYKKESKNDPIIIVDGKVVNKDILEQLKTEKIDKMQVIKGKEALKKYNAPNGVIIITTKKR